MPAVPVVRGYITSPNRTTRKKKGNGKYNTWLERSESLQSWATRTVEVDISVLEVSKTCPKTQTCVLFLRRLECLSVSYEKCHLQLINFSQCESQTRSNQTRFGSTLMGFISVSSRHLTWSESTRKETEWEETTPRSTLRDSSFTVRSTEPDPTSTRLVICTVHTAGRGPLLVNLLRC